LPSEVKVATVERSLGSPFLKVMVTGEELSPPDQVMVTGVPAVTDDGVEVKAKVLWAAAKVARVEAPTRRALKNCMLLRSDGW